MSDEEPSIKKAVRKQDSFWTSHRILFVFFLVIGLVAGYAVERYVLHPFFSADPDSLGQCKRDNQLLFDNLNACLRGETSGAAPADGRSS